MICFFCKFSSRCYSTLGIVYLPTTSTKWSSAVDQGVYNGGGVAEGAYVAVAKVSAGKAAFIGDSSAVEDATPKYKKEEDGGTKTTYAGYQEQNDAKLLVNTVNWLATKETTPALPKSQALLWIKRQRCIRGSSRRTRQNRKPNHGLRLLQVISGGIARRTRRVPLDTHHPQAIRPTLSPLYIKHNCRIKPCSR